MPCDSIQTSEVNFNFEATDLDLLQKALEGLGYSVSQLTKTKELSFFKAGYQPVRGTYSDGKFSAEVRGEVADFDVNEVKRAYSTEVVKAASKRFGWSLKETGQQKFEVQKRFS